jgi:hypothetical protein
MSGSSQVWMFAAIAAVIVLAFGASLYWVGRPRARRQAMALALAAPLLVASG